MELRPLGPTGTFVSELCLGTMTFGAETDADEAFRICDAYREAGGTFVDTADVYSAGASEEILGRWLEQRGARDDVVLATKVNFPVGADRGPNHRGLSRPNVHRAVRASLARLGVDDVDLLQVHAWDPLTPIDETLEALDELVRAGHVAYVGISNHAGWQLATTLERARAQGLAVPVSLQAHYNLLGRELEWELTPLCEHEGLGLLPWSPLAGGWLTGKYRRAEQPTGATRLGEDPQRGIEAWDKRNTERTWQVIEVLLAVADELGASPAQVALRWVTDRPTVSSTVLGARTVDQLADNLGAAQLTLPEDARARLDEASAVPAPDYPYGFLAELDAARRGGTGLG